jgi:membrane-anchored glycerophosphoryl diester phosphodiesterase (GDPDase)
LTLGVVVFIEKDREIMESLKMSWDVTKGNVLGILIISIAISLIIGAFSYFVSMPSTVYLQSAILTSGNVEGIVGFGMIIQNMTSILTSPIYIILLIPVILLSAYQLIALTYLLPVIYKLLITKDKSKLNQETYHF